MSLGLKLASHTLYERCTPTCVAVVQQHRLVGAAYAQIGASVYRRTDPRCRSIGSLHLYLAWQADGLHNALDDEVDSARHALNNSSIGSPRRIRSKILFLAVAPGLLFAAGEGAAKTVGTACMYKTGEVYALAPYRSAPRQGCLEGDETVRLSLDQPDTAFAKKRHTIGPNSYDVMTRLSGARNS